MKLKSLLLGSAAVLALSTGAQAADPIVEFVSLGVCDTYGITGLTIESDDTCLAISGEVSYEYSSFDLGGGWFAESNVDWELVFEATTQTDAGAAVAHLGFVDADDEILDGDNVITYTEDLVVDEAYVQFGDTTVLSAGLKDSILDTEVLDRTYGTDVDDHDPFDWDFDENDLTNEVQQGGHVIQVESLIADGFSVVAALEDLDGEGTALVAAEYASGNITAEAAILMGDLYGPTDPINYFARVTAEFDGFEVRGGVIADDSGDWIASVGASATFDMFTLDTDAYFRENDDWGVAGEGAFSATDTIDVYIGAGYQEVAALEQTTFYGGVNVDVIESVTANAEIGYTDTGAEEFLYGEAGVTYAPGGGFETGLSAFVDDNEHYKVTFEASKEF